MYYISCIAESQFAHCRLLKSIHYGACTLINLILKIILFDVSILMKSNLYLNKKCLSKLFCTILLLYLNIDT